MLVLARNVGEELIINDDIKITILAVNKSQVKVGIEAPKKVNVVRSELLKDGKGTYRRGKP